MSRFFGASSSDTDESSSDDGMAPAPQRPQSTRVFLMSDDEEDQKRVVRSAKEKSWEGLENLIKSMRNARKINDMVKVLDDFDNLCKQYVKAKNVIAKEGIPPFYIRNLVETEDHINELWEDKEARKKMSKVNSKSLSTMRQKYRRYIRDFEKEMKEYRENPDAVEHHKEEEPSEPESSDDEVQPTGFLKAPAKAATSWLKKEPKGGDDDDDDSDIWMSSSEDESSDSDAETGGRQLTAEYFLKKKPGTESKEETDKPKRKREQKEGKSGKKSEDEEEEEEGWEKVKQTGKGKHGGPIVLFKKDTEIDHKVVLKKLNEIIQNRGRKSTDKQNQVALLKQLRIIAEQHSLGLGITIKLLFNIIAAFFDYNTKTRDCMKTEPWNDVLKHLEELLDLLLTNDNILVSENITDTSENMEDSTVEYRVKGNVVALLEKLDSEFIKILQNADAHSTEYVQLLRDESKVMKNIQKLSNYVEAKGSSEDICVAYLLRIQHLYYKFDYKARDERIAAEKKELEFEGMTEEEKQDVEKDPVLAELGENSAKVMDELCKFIYTKDSSDRIRTRAILHHIYHHALHDRWYQARDLMLMSHLQENIGFSDVPTQILYNRTMVQLGLCAFRQGLMQEAHNALVDIQSSGRAKELLAQGLLIQRQGERLTPEQEKLEKGRQIPFHMHINLELLECVYLVSAMLLEIPYIAAHEFDARRRMISKQFHHQLRVSERQALLGPPDNMREHVVAAAKAMKMGDHVTCLQYIINDKMNNKVWGLFSESHKVKAMLEEKIKEESLRTYLFTYSQFYDNMSISLLSELFQLDQASCHRIISKMIFNEELAASWDEPSSSLVLHKTDPTRLQNMALQLADKVTALVDVNERILESKSSGGGFQNYRQDGQDQRNYQQGGRGGRRNQQNYRGGYNNRREGGGGGGYFSKGGYQGNRSGGYQGNRSGGYQGNRSGGYQGNRSGGYQGSYGNRSGGYRKQY
uniref:eukaryotic translation initiation factor 3 subunit C-like n=1 Tax=Styela clava TaxID=7725 RepID=UPI001939DE6A|nr:eukaryotic translation initiation factor 3 subunit C-like [Styela clava]